MRIKNFFTNSREKELKTNEKLSGGVKKGFVGRKILSTLFFKRAIDSTMKKTDLLRQKMNVYDTDLNKIYSEAEGLHKLVNEGKLSYLRSLDQITLKIKLNQSLYKEVHLQYKFRHRLLNKLIVASRIFSFHLRNLTDHTPIEKNKVLRESVEREGQVREKIMNERIKEIFSTTPLFSCG